MIDQSVSRSDMVRALASHHEYDQGLIRRALYNYFDDMTYNNLDKEYSSMLESIEQ